VIVLQGQHTAAWAVRRVVQVGRAKEKAAEADKKKKRSVEKFVSFINAAEGLYSNTSWQEFDEAFKNEDEFKAVRAL
jgi:hypothetical protein